MQPRDVAGPIFRMPDMAEILTQNCEPGSCRGVLEVVVVGTSNVDDTPFSDSVTRYPVI